MILSFRFGRDFFDLFFYLSRWPDVVPNISYLNEALQQTGYSGPEVKEENWKMLAAAKAQAVAWDQILMDVEPFLLRPEDRKVFDKAILLQMLVNAAG